MVAAWLLPVLMAVSAQAAPPAREPVQDTQPIIVTGKVSDRRIPRNSGHKSWEEPLLESIRGRLYAPLEKPSGRQERYTDTSRWEVQTGSHIERRSPRARVEYLDLTRRETVSPS